MSFQWLGVEGVGIEVRAQPLQGFGMALVAGIFKRFEHLAITPRAADVFGRTAAGRLDQARIEDVGFGERDALDLDRVLPAVAVVVEITQRLGPASSSTSIRLALRASSGPPGQSGDG